MTNGELFELIKNTLKAADIEDYLFDSKCIFEDIMHMSGTELMLHKNDIADKAAADKALKLAKRRSEGYPLQYLLGEWEFYGLKFKIGEGVLIPRPDTEVLVDEVIGFFGSENNSSPEIVDLCSGSGCIG